MRLRGPINAALLVALALLSAIAWWAARGPAAPPPLTALDPRSVAALALRYPRGDAAPVELERRRDGWWLTRPVEHRARDGRVVSALTVLAARSEDCYPGEAHDAADFGLATPRLRLETEGAALEFGDRSADGRRYVAAGDRFCLLADRHYPLLKQGLDGIADLSLLAGREPRRIAVPGAEARHDGERWRMVEGAGDAGKWAANWRRARAARIVLNPPAADRGRVRIATADAIREWRLARLEPAPVLVPRGADHGLALAGDAASRLLEPPAAQE